MLRRRFIKTCAALCVSPELKLKKQDHVLDLFANCSNFADIFTTMNYTGWNEQEIPFSVGNLPLDQCTIKPLLIESDSKEGLKAKVNRMAAELIVSAATDRNILVYDEKDDYGEMTIRLYNLIGTNIRQNANEKSAEPFGGENLTDVFLRNSKAPPNGCLLNSMGEEQKTKARWHAIPDQVWDYLEDYYFNVLEGSLIPGDKNLVLGLTRYKAKNEFVYPVVKNSYLNPKSGKYNELSNMGVLNNRRLILASF